MLLIMASYQRDLDGLDKVPPGPVALSRISSVSSGRPAFTPRGKMRGWWSAHLDHSEKRGGSLNDR